MTAIVYRVVSSEHPEPGWQCPACRRCWNPRLLYCPFCDHAASVAEAAAVMKAKLEAQLEIDAQCVCDATPLSCPVHHPPTDPAAELTQ